VIAAESGASVDVEGFEKRMEEQRARGTFAGSGETGIADAHKALAAEMGENEFLGYEKVASEATLEAILSGGKRVQKLQAGEISTRAQLDGYVYRVALNHFRNHQRKDKSRVSNHDAAAELPDRDDRGLPESLEKAQCVKVARELLNEVKPARDRDLLVRFYLYEETKEQLCQSFGLSELHFNRVIFRARARFRDLLKRRGLGKSDFLSIAAILFCV